MWILKQIWSDSLSFKFNILGADTMSKGKAFQTEIVLGIKETKS